MIHELDINDVMEAICAEFHVTEAAIVSKVRVEPVTDARKALSLIMYYIGGWPVGKVAEKIRRKAASVNGYKRAARDLFRYDRLFKWRFERCMSRLDFDDEFIRQFIKNIINDKI